MRCLWVLVAFVYFQFAAPTYAGVIIQPAAIIGNTLGENSSTPASNLIDQIGLSPNYVSGVTDYETYVQGLHYNSTVAGWGSLTYQTTGVMTFDLGQVYSLQSFALWNGSGFYRQQVYQFDLVADLDGDFTSGSINLGAFQAHDRTSQGDIAKAEVFNFATTEARYVRWFINANEGNGFGTIANEVAFEAIGVPVPSSFTIFGLAWITFVCLWRCDRNVSQRT